MILDKEDTHDYFLNEFDATGQWLTSHALHVPMMGTMVSFSVEVTWWCYGILEVLKGQLPWQIWRWLEWRGRSRFKRHWMEKSTWEGEWKLCIVVVDALFMVFVDYS